MGHTVRRLSVVKMSRPGQKEIALEIQKVIKFPLNFDCCESTCDGVNWFLHNGY